jgi:hypothetical protein
MYCASVKWITVVITVKIQYIEQSNPQPTINYCHGNTNTRQYILWHIYCNIETCSRDYATVGEAVFSPCWTEQNQAEPNQAEPSRAKPWWVAHRIASPRLLPGNSYKHLDNARVGKGHVNTSRVSSDGTIKVLSRMLDQGFIGVRSRSDQSVLDSRQPRKVHKWRRRSDRVNWRL